jgi:DNA-binding IclR family transcriptional regulator
MPAPAAVKSAARSLQVLELFELLKRPASLMEIAGALGYPASSTSMLVRTLCQMGYLNRDPATQRFAPTMRLALMGGWIRAEGADGHALAALVADAQHATGLSAVLSTRHGLDVQYIYVDRVTPRGFSSRNPNSGTLRPICHCAAGLMMLAEESDERVALIARNASALRGRRIPLDELMAKLAAARREGYAWQFGANRSDVGDVAVRVPVDDPFGQALVLSVGAAAQQVREEHAVLGRKLRNLTQRFAEALPQP